MKITNWFFILLLLLSSFAYAQEEANDCGNDLRCKFRQAASGDADACDSLEGVSADNCKEFADAQEITVTPISRPSPTASSKSLFEVTDKPFVLNTVAGMIIAVLGFIVLVLFLFFRHYQQSVFIRNHDTLMGYIKKCSEDGMSKDSIKKSLEKVGWKKDIINEAIKDSKIKK